MNTKLFQFIELVVVIVLIINEIEGSPPNLRIDGKPPKCPYGKCYMDRCKRICSCVPKEGHISCTKEYNLDSWGCAEPAKENEDNCPLGKTYRDTLWPKHFLCYCNNDSSQTYECFDLSTQKPADAGELLKYSKSSPAARAKEMLKFPVY